MTRRIYYLPPLILVATASALIWIWTRFAELWAPSVAFYAGLVILLTGLLSLIRPLKFFGIQTRRAAAMVALSGVAIGMGSLMWPVTDQPASANGSTELDRLMPRFDRSERHEIAVHASSEVVRRAVEEVTFSDIRGLQTLLSLRAAKQVKVVPKPVLATMTRPGAAFTLLARTDGEFVAGNAGRPWLNERPAPVHDAAEFSSFSASGYAKVAFNMRVVETEPGWCKVTTETRILANGDGARQAFIRYWRIVYPGSALIRVLWLDAVQRRVSSYSARPATA